MTQSDAPTRLLLVVTGGVMAAITPGWINALRASIDCTVQALLTPAASELVSARALSVLTGRPVLGPGWSESQHDGAEHVVAASWAQRVVVAPATLDFCAKLAAGISDDLATTTVHSVTAPTFVLPSVPSGAMDKPVTRRVLRTLDDDGYLLVEAEKTRSVTTGELEPGGPGSLDDLIAALTASGMRATSG